MNRDEFKLFLQKIYTYFRLDKIPSGDQINLWADDVKHIPYTAADDVFKILKESETLPRNIPKFIRQAYMQLPKRQKIKQYDPYDDTDYPIENLWTAFDILEKQGNDKFMAYCRASRMPQQDIERVRNKFNCAIKADDIKKLAGNVGESVVYPKNEYSREYLNDFRNKYQS